MNLPTGMPASAEESGLSYLRLPERFSAIDSVDQLVSLMRAKDLATDQHTARVAAIGRHLAGLLGLGEADRDVLETGAWLHDVGKLCVPNRILNKRGSLTASEWRIIQSHPDTGLRLAATVELDSQVRAIIGLHHERWDGSGYPNGIRGLEIPLVVRVFQLADIYDALASERPYKPAYSKEQIEAVFHRELRNGWRDPGLLEWFLDFGMARLADVEPVRLTLVDTLAGGEANARDGG